MASASFVPDLALGLAVKISAAIETGRIEDLAADEVSAAIFACQSLRHLFALARTSIEKALRQGVDARAFASACERAILGLDAATQTAERVAAKVHAGRLPALAEELLANYQDLAADIANLRQFLGEALSSAKAPARPIDWNRVHAAEAAFDGGETKPFQRS